MWEKENKNIEYALASRLESEKKNGFKMGSETMTTREITSVIALMNYANIDTGMQIDSYPWGLSAHRGVQRIDDVIDSMGNAFSRVTDSLWNCRFRDRSGIMPGYDDKSRIDNLISLVSGLGENELPEILSELAVPDKVKNEENGKHGKYRSIAKSIKKI